MGEMEGRVQSARTCCNALDGSFHAKKNRSMRHVILYVHSDIHGSKKKNLIGIVWTQNVFIKSQSIFVNFDGILDFQECKKWTNQ